MRSPRMHVLMVQKQMDLYLRGRKGLSIFSLEEVERCQLWSEARENGYSAAKSRGISAVYGRCD